MPGPKSVSGMAVGLMDGSDHETEGNELNEADVGTPGAAVAGVAAEGPEAEDTGGAAAGAVADEAAGEAGGAWRAT